MAIKGDKASRREGWEGGKNAILKSATQGTCLKSKAEMWLTNGMGGLHKVKQVRIV